MKVNKGDIIKINWIDANTYVGYYTEMNKKDIFPQKVISVGIFIGQDKETIVFADYNFIDSEGEDYKYIHIIPKEMVKKITILEKKEVVM